MTAFAAGDAPSTLCGIGHGDLISKVIERFGPPSSEFEKPVTREYTWLLPEFSIFVTSLKGDKRIRVFDLMVATAQRGQVRAAITRALGADDSLLAHIDETIAEFCQSYAPTRHDVRRAEFDLPNGQGILAVQAHYSDDKISGFRLTLEYPVGPVPVEAYEEVAEPRRGKLDVRQFTTLFGIAPGFLINDVTTMLGPYDHVQKAESWSEYPEGSVLLWSPPDAPLRIALTTIGPGENELISRIELRAMDGARDRWSSIREVYEAKGLNGDAVFDLFFRTHDEVLDLLGDADWASEDRPQLRYMIPMRDNTHRTIALCFSEEETPVLIEITLERKESYRE